MINKEDNNPSQRLFLINLNFAIKEWRKGPLGARGKTSIRVFMAIRVLLSEKYSFRHNLELVFQVLFWIYIHYNGLGKDISITKFKCWKYKNTIKLAKLKSRLVSRERYFLNRTKIFTPYYKPLILQVNKLRKVVFLIDRRQEKEDRGLYS